MGWSTVNSSSRSTSSNAFRRCREFSSSNAPGTRAANGGAPTRRMFSGRTVSRAAASGRACGCRRSCASAASRRRAPGSSREGADAASVARSIPIAKAMKDVLVAYAQNGEPLRPEQGYPAASDRAGRRRDHEHQVAASVESHRSAGDDALGDVEVHGPSAGRHIENVLAGDGREINHHATVRR